MKKLLFLILAVMIIFSACKPKPESEMNPFFTEWDTPFQVPPFD
jgi:hypothetical protein